jgi:hypothetical protein
MARFSYQVEKIVGLSEIILTNVQSVGISRGRVQIQDPFKTGTATITGRVPSSLPTLDVGTLIRIRVYDSDGFFIYVAFTGRVADVRISYGEVANMDTWTIYAEDAMADAGRALTTGTGGFASGDTTWQAAEKIALDAGIPLDLFPSSVSGSTVSAQSLPNTNALNILQELIFTEQGRIYSSPTANELIWQDRNNIFRYDTAFTDGTVTLPPQYVPIAFNDIQFFSQADSFADRVVIEPAGLSDQSSGTGDRVFTGKSYDQTTTQAGNLADYVRSTLSVQVAKPQTVSCVSESQVNNEMMSLFQAAGSLATALVVLRGVQYQVFVEGAVLTGNPDQTRITFNLVSADALNFFRLDAVDFGVLDQNKLGF